MKPMKLTALAVFITGVIIAVYALLSLFIFSSSATVPREAPPTSFPIVAYLLPVAIIAMVSGAWMWLYGGSGSTTTRDPSIRN